MARQLKQQMHAFLHDYRKNVFELEHRVIRADGTVGHPTPTAARSRPKPHSNRTALLPV